MTPSACSPRDLLSHVLYTHLFSIICCRTFVGRNIPPPTTPPDGFCADALWHPDEFNDLQPSRMLFSFNYTQYTRKNYLKCLQRLKSGVKALDESVSVSLDKIAIILTD